MLQRISFLYVLLFSLSLFANPNQILKSNQLSYYGEKFYQQRKLTKHDLHLILSGKHQYNSGSFDKIDNSCVNNCYQHSKNDYQNAREILFGDLFKQQDQNGNYVVDVYCEKKIYYTHISDISRMGDIVNIEHTWPQSKFSSSYDKNLQKGDLHHLFPSDSFANNIRGNNQFGDAAGEEVENCSLSRAQEISGYFVFSPPKNHKGNIARALFYFSTRYQLSIPEAEEMILKMWHKSDPVDANEINRHQKISQYQKNRNPFIDFPNIVENILDF